MTDKCRPHATITDTRDGRMLVTGPYGQESAPTEQPVQIGLAVLHCLFNIKVGQPRPHRLPEETSNG
jgi:hypothetical protein